MKTGGTECRVSLQHRSEPDNSSPTGNDGEKLFWEEGKT